ncbi:MAG: hypothetical protein QXL94_00355 [Candidatus Parvarchaeum sp.]
MKPTEARECPFFERCNAPVCPVDNEGTWYYDEDICKNSDFNNEKIIRTQKSLRKYKAEGIFTRDLLMKIQRVRKTTKGEKVE